MKLTDNLKEMLEARASLVKEARAYVEEHKEDWTADRQATHEKRMEDIGKLNDHIQNLQNLESATSDLAGFDSISGGEAGAGSSGDPQDAFGFTPVNSVSFRSGRSDQVIPFAADQTAQPSFRQAFRDYVNLRMAPSNGGSFENALTYGGANGEEYMTAPMQFYSEFLRGCDQVSVLRQLATVIPLNTIRDLGIRKRTKKTSSFAWNCVCKPPTPDEPGIGLRTMSLNQASFSSAVCRDLLRRSNGFDVEGYLAQELSRDAGDNLEQAFLLGDGVKKPLGLFYPSNDGISTNRDVLTGNVGAITASDFIQTKMSLCTTCRTGAAASRLSWIVPSGTLTQLMLLQDGNGQYLWRPGIAEGYPDTILGHPVRETNAFSVNIATDEYVAIIGDFSRYFIAEGPTLGLERDLDIFTDQVVWVGRLYIDGMPVEEDCFARLKVK